MNSILIIQFFALGFLMTFVKTKAVERVKSSPVSVPVTSDNGAEINVNLTSDFLLTSLGFIGEAAVNQQTVEGVVGSSDAPASLTSQSNSIAVVESSGNIDEVAVVDFPQETVSTLNSVDTEILTGASEQIQAVLSGVNASVEYAGESVVPLGGGVTFSNANTEVEILG